MGWIGTRWMLIAVAGSGLLIAACGGAQSHASASGPAAEPSPSPTAIRPGISAGLCLTCHSRQGLVVTTSPGQERPLEVLAPDRFYASAHGNLSCLDCHKDQAALPHAKFTETGEPIAETRDSTAVCSSCHREAYERYLDSVHGTVVHLGDSRAPGCTDCHTTHYVQPVKTWTDSDKAQQACSRCHKGADAAFASAITHREPSPSRLAVNYFAGRFFGALVVMVLGIGILHVELDLLRWIKRRVRRRQ